MGDLTVVFNRFPSRIHFILVIHLLLRRAGLLGLIEVIHVDLKFLSRVIGICGDISVADRDIYGLVQLVIFGAFLIFDRISHMFDPLSELRMINGIVILSLLKRGRHGDVASSWRALELLDDLWQLSVDSHLRLFDLLDVLLRGRIVLRPKRRRLVQHINYVALVLGKHGVIV